MNLKTEIQTKNKGTVSTLKLPKLFTESLEGIYKQDRVEGLATYFKRDGEGYCNQFRIVPKPKPYKGVNKIGPFTINYNLEIKQDGEWRRLSGIFNTVTESRKKVVKISFRDSGNALNHFLVEQPSETEIILASTRG